MGIPNDLRNRDALFGPPSPQEVLSSMLVPNQRAIFILGSFERQVSIYHQQIRALNLTYALHSLGYCDAKGGSRRRIAIIGAGVAGLTLSAGLSCCPSCEVTVFEKKSRPLSVIEPENIGNRYLHQHLYAWPSPRQSEEVVSRIRGPLLDWKPGFQKSVVKQLLDQWHDTVRSNAIASHFNSWNIRLKRPSGGQEVSLVWNDRSNEGKAHEEPFDIVILAMGFGLETNLPFAEGNSYWEADEIANWIQQDSKAFNRRPRYLISGTGDGAWTDLFRLAIPKFRQDKLRVEWLDPYVSVQQKRDIAYEEDMAVSEAAFGGNPSRRLTEFYQSLPLESLEKILKERFDAKYSGNPQPELFLNSTDKNYVVLGSFPANRLLGSQLVKSGIVQRIEGRIGETERCTFDGNPKAVRLVFQDGRTKEVDRLIVRHGTASALNAFDRSLFDQTRQILQRVALVDRTRLPAWPENYFDESIRRPSEYTGEKRRSVFGGRRIEQFAIRTASAWKSARSTTELRAACQADVPLDMNSNCPVAVLAFDKWIERELEDWLAAVVNFAFFSPNQLNLIRPYIPIVIDLQQLLDAVESKSANDDAVLHCLNSISQIPFSTADLSRWPDLTGAAWLFLIRVNRSCDKESLDAVTMMLEKVFATGTYRAFLIAPSSQLGDISPETEVIRFFPASENRKQESGLKGLSDKKQLEVKRLFNLFSESGDRTWSMVEAAKNMVIAGKTARITTPGKFVGSLIELVAEKYGKSHVDISNLLEWLSVEITLHGSDSFGTLWIERSTAEENLPDGIEKRLIDLLVDNEIVSQGQFGPLMLPNYSPQKLYLSIPSTYLQRAFASRSFDDIREHQNLNAKTRAELAIQSELDSNNVDSSLVVESAKHLLAHSSFPNVQGAELVGVAAREHSEVKQV